MGPRALAPTLLCGLLSPASASSCSGTARLDVNASVQTFSDGSAPGAPYADNLNCSWLLSAPVGGAVRLGFVRFDTEHGITVGTDDTEYDDNVTVYDGASASSPLLGIFNGDAIPPGVQSTGAAMLVHFASNLYNTGAFKQTGFEVQYTLVSSAPFPTPAPTPDLFPTPAPGTLGCTAAVNPAAATPPPAGTCVSIGPCLDAMPAICATKTLLLQVGSYTGPQNTRIDLVGTESVAIVGPVLPAPLRAGAGGAVELDDTAAAPLAPAVATIDGEHAAWLFAVGGNAILSLANVVLARGRSGRFDRGDGVEIYGGGALRVTGSGALNATGVLFDSNEAVEPVGISMLSEGGAMFSSSDGAAQVDGCTFRNNTATGLGYSFGGGAVVRGASAAVTASVAPVFKQCLFERNSAANGGGGAAVQDASLHFSGCTWFDNVVTGSSGEGGGIYVSSSSVGSAVAMTPLFDRCLFEGNRVVYEGGGAHVQDAVPRFRGCTWRGNAATGSSGEGGGVDVYSSSATGAAYVAPVFEQCLFEGNIAGKEGGGASVTDAMARFTGCMWRGNSATSRGGGVHVTSSSATAFANAFENSAFIGNTAGGNGGGALATTVLVADVPANLAFKAGKCSNYTCVQPFTFADPPPTVDNTFRQWMPHLQLLFNGSTIFEGNSVAAASGGAISIGTGGSVIVRGNASFLNNRAGIFGGAAYLKAGTASLTLLGTSTWKNNTADSARGDHFYSESSGAIALGDAVLQLGGEPTRVREGMVAEAAGNVSWGAKSSVACEPGFTLSALTDITTSTHQTWVLEGSSNGTSGFRNGSNCPGYYAYCNGIGLSKIPYWAALGYHDPTATPVFPSMLVTRISMGCAACSAAEWTDGAQTLPGLAVAAATIKHPLKRTCTTCAGHMSPGIWCNTGELAQKQGWWRPDAAVGFGTELFPCYTDTCVGSGSHQGLPAFDVQCKTGYTGPVCSVCTSDFVRRSGACVFCPRDGMATDAIAGVATICVAIVVVMMLAHFFRNRIHMPLVKIVLGFYSLLAVLGNTFGILWPSAFTGVLAYTKAFADVLQLSVLTCSLHIQHYHELCFWTFGLLGVLAAVTALYACKELSVPSEARVSLRRESVILYTYGVQFDDGDRDRDVPQISINGPSVELRIGDKVEARCKRSKKHKAGKISMVNGGRRVGGLRERRNKALFYVLLFAYPFVCPPVIATFICRTVGGTSYLVADYSLQCDTPVWGVAVAWCSLWVVVYVVGLPVMVVIAVLGAASERDTTASQRGNTERHWAAAAIDGYKEKRSYWEALEMARKLLLSSAILLFDKGTPMQIAVATVLSVAFLIAHTLYEPFKEPKDNRLQTLALFALFGTYFIGLLLKMQPSAEQSKQLALLLVAMSLSVLLTALFSCGMLVQETRRTLSGNESSMRVEVDLEMSTQGGEGGVWTSCWQRCSAVACWCRRRGARPAVPNPSCISMAVLDTAESNISNPAYGEDTHIEAEVETVEGKRRRAQTLGLGLGLQK
jgi:hypothetical protein